MTIGGLLIETNYSDVAHSLLINNMLYDTELTFYFIANRCAVQKVNLQGFEEGMCLFYQTYPVAHAGMKMDFADKSLASNVMRGCYGIIKLAHSEKNVNFHLNVGLMTGVYDVKTEQFLEQVIGSYTIK